MNEIDKAIKLLQENGYVVHKLTARQIQDSKECDESGFEKDCLCCSCSCCILQG